MSQTKTHTDMMQALVLMEPGCLSVQRRAVPEPGVGELLVRVRAATTCGTDLKAFLRGHPQIPTPGVFGHEYAGEVVATGPAAKFRPGTSVMGVHSAPCLECRWCVRGQENLCESVMATKVLGSYAEYLLIPRRIAELNVFEKPDSIGFAQASLLEPLSCVAHGIDQAKPRKDDSILVIGPGAIGLMFVAALTRLGHRPVTLAGRNPGRLHIGESLGARPVHVEDIRGRFDVVIECTGRVDIWERSLGFVEKGGTLVLFGGCPAGSFASFDTRRIHYDEIRLLSPFHFGRGDVLTARDWLIDPEWSLDALLTGDRELADAPQVFKDLEAGIGIKYVFRP